MTLKSLRMQRSGEINVTAYGAVGDGVKDDTVAIQSAINAAFGTAQNPNGTAKVGKNQILLFPPGKYKITAPLIFTKLHGGKVMGAGRFVTQIENVTANQPVVQTNGCGYAQFEGLLLKAAAGGTCFDLDWDGTAGGAALQSNSFRDMFFQEGAYGVQIGKSGFMGSENLFQNCFWIGQTSAGLITNNFNALQNTVIGGNFQGCNVGIWNAVGSTPFVSGVGFQQSVDYDIRVDGGAYNTIVVQGCRTESQNFLKLASGSGVVYGCTQTSSIDGDFIRNINCYCDVAACTTTRGQIFVQQAPQMSIRATGFGRIAWYATNGLSKKPPDPYSAAITLEHVSYGWLESQNNEILYEKRNADGVVVNATGI